MEYWSFEKKASNPFVITPTLHYSKTPKVIEMKASTMDHLFSGYRSEKDQSTTGSLQTEIKWQQNPPKSSN
jgi:hypothetical protein